MKPIAQRYLQCTQHRNPEMNVTRLPKVKCAYVCVCARAGSFNAPVRYVLQFSGKNILTRPNVFANMHQPHTVLCGWISTRHSSAHFCKFKAPNYIFYLLVNNDNNSLGNVKLQFTLYIAILKCDTSYVQYVFKMSDM
jgi:hypothetical protein